MPTSALEVAEIAKKREAEERIKTLKEQKQYVAKGDRCSRVSLPLLILWADTFSSRRER